MDNNNQKAVDLFNKMADSYQKRFFSVDCYSESLNSFLAYLSDHSSVLDVACGPGNISHFLLKQKPGLKLLGIDLAPNMINLARINNPTAQFRVYDAMEIDRLDSSFDAIIIGFLFPYLSAEQVELFLIKTYEKLSDNGIVYLSTMEDLYENSRLKASSTGEELMMHYYEETFLVRLLEQIGFQILSKHTQPFVISETETDTDLIIIAQKKGFFKKEEPVSMIPAQQRFS
ncbi:class I SAM-dependent DNA methyltransferase [Fluviicola chungangensis]|uniref:Methyltransferase domain-containing protein n=1 Tax=Fluviicola chungangensis TaxID=2597671 RepID=A0A556MPN0_9FLAO|nr:class I SAM-dependent methyltransferase [Fluviicola chungangensis]TSJ41903.1 methyltransferase domain-containing protein [Fluviicola chungangensis]